MKSVSMSFKDSTKIDSKKLETSAKSLSPYLKELQKAAASETYDGKETSLHLPSDKAIADQSCELEKKMNTDSSKYIFVIGIGGSYLGAMAMYEAMTGKYDLMNDVVPKLVFLDTVSGFTMNSIFELVDEHVDDADDIAVVLVSKSGTTTEQNVNFNALYGYLTKKLGDIRHRVAVITGKDSALFKQAAEHGYHIVEHPEVGGRYSVMSPVGQVPLRLAQFDVDAMLEGAEAMRDMCLQDDIEKNPALASAVLLYEHAQEGMNINVNFFFNPELESLGKWYRQLMGESIGKLQDVDGKEVYNGITPIISMGTADLHSMLQLYLGGPRNTFTTFVYGKQDVEKLIIEDDLKIVDGIDGKSMDDILKAIYEATEKSYQNHERPFMDVQLPEVNEYYIGQFMQMKMIEMMFLAKLMNVNAFDQPQVEDYKSEARKLLG